MHWSHLRHLLKLRSASSSMHHVISASRGEVLWSKCWCSRFACQKWCCQRLCDPAKAGWGRRCGIALVALPNGQPWGGTSVTVKLASVLQRRIRTMFQSSYLHQHILLLSFMCCLREPNASALQECSYACYRCIYVNLLFRPGVHTLGVAAVE